jgi:hypothetical protein
MTSATDAVGTMPFDVGTRGLVRGGRVDDDQRVRTAAAKSRQSLGAPAVSDLEVEQDDIRVFVIRELYGDVEIARLQYHVATRVVVEPDRDQVTDVRFVVDDEHALLHVVGVAQRVP